MLIEMLPKGAIPDPIDERDYKIEALGATALPPVDWSKGSGLPVPLISDQGSSDACGPHATTKYHRMLNPKNYSIRDLSARVLLPEYGSTARDNIMAIVNEGQDITDNVRDPNPQTPSNMRDKTGLSLEREKLNRELDGWRLPENDIDSVASAIIAYKGVLFGVTGSNPGWQNLTHPRPPKPGETWWGHFLYPYDFHIHDGKKCIITSTSWASAGVIEHHIDEDYFKAGFTFNPWTLIPRKRDDMDLKENNGFYFLQGPLGYIGINKPEFLNAMLRIVKPEDIKHGAPTGPQLGIIETAPESFVIKDK